MRGKQTCRILREIRAEIARRNDIEWAVRECTFQGECRGTCPRCEREVRDLERQLAKRRRLQKGVALAGVCAGMIAALSGCDALVDAQPAPSAAPTEEALLAGEAPSSDLIDDAHETTPVLMLGMVTPEDGVEAQP